MINGTSSDYWKLERMGTRRRIAVALLVTAGVAIAAVAVVVWTSRDVAIQLVNRTNQNIESVLLHFDTCGAKTTMAGDGLAIDQSRLIKHTVCGEGAYVVEVVLADGKKMSSKGLYVESGYTSTEIIKSDGITSTLQTYAL